MALPSPLSLLETLLPADCGKRDPVFRDKVTEDTSPHLLAAQDQRLGAKRDKLSRGSTGTPSGSAKRPKLPWFRNVTRPDSLSNLSFRAPWRPGELWSAGNDKWTTSRIGRFHAPMPELLTMTSRRKDRKRISAKSFLMSLHPLPYIPFKGLN